MKKKFTTALLALSFGVFAQTSPQTYSVAGNYTFTVPVGVTSLTIEVVGAGGSGGGNGGGGGGGGGYAKGVYNVTPGATLAVQVGAVGSGPAAGTSSVNGLISATGGGNGTFVSNPNIGGGGAAGIGSGGTINNSGGIGGGGYWTYFGGGGAGAGGPLSNGSNGGNTIAWTGVCQTPGGSGGTGGGAPGGNGGKGAGFTDSGCNVTNPAANGGNFGAGGGGGNGNGGGPATGAGGFCEITWLSCATPAAPTNTTPITNQSICANKSATLFVTGSSLNWYASSTSTTVLASGISYVTPTLTTGNYTYYAASTNTCGEGPRTAITVTVNALPTVSISASTSLICSGQSVTLTASGAQSYSWNTAATTTVIVASPTVTTIYTVTGTSINNCVNTFTMAQQVSPCTGVVVNGHAQNSSLSVYPNPNKGDFTIATGTEMNVSIVNTLGQLVKTVSVSASTNFKVAVTDLPNGIYFITDTNNKNNSQKIVVSK